MPSSPKASSSVMVFPCSVAPAASSAATGGADVDAGACVLSQSGLPPPVGTPATSIRSLTAKLNPSSGPDAVGARVSNGPGTNAPKSADADPADAMSGAAALAERGHHRAGIGDEAKALLDVPDGCFGTELR